MGRFFMARSRTRRTSYPVTFALRDVFFPLEEAQLIGISARMVVPFRGADSMENLPPTISIRSRDPSNPNRLCLVAKRTRSTSNDLPSSWTSRETAFWIFPNAHIHVASVSMLVHIGQR